MTDVLTVLSEEQKLVYYKIILVVRSVNMFQVEILFPLRGVDLPQLEMRPGVSSE